MKRKPLFITFEGGEGSGKSTQLELFYNWFIKCYGKAILTREPGGEHYAEKIRAILLEHEDQRFPMYPQTELFLFEAARVQHLRNIVMPALADGKSALCDRFADSTTAYQGYGSEMSLKDIEAINRIATRGITPDATFLLDVTPELGLMRTLSREQQNRIDIKDIDFHKRVRRGYLEIAKSNPKRIIIVNANNELEEVQKEIKEKFAERFLK
ncbi:MAG: dTMP kinase [Candidatus Pacearchaeota archaeon]